jgi:hypothetical protein
MVMEPKIVIKVVLCLAFVSVSKRNWGMLVKFGVVSPFWLRSFGFVVGPGYDLPADAEPNKTQEKKNAGGDSCNE